MPETQQYSVVKESRRKLRWWPAAVILAVVLMLLGWIWTVEASYDQIRTMRTAPVVGITFLLFLLWWLLASGVSWKTRFLGLFVLSSVGVVVLASLRFEGVDGNLFPILAWRWATSSSDSIIKSDSSSSSVYFTITESDYPQFLGPDRDARLTGPLLSTDWVNNSPNLLWKQPIGAGWSSYAIVGQSAITQEQRGSMELVVSYDLRTGKVIWVHRDESHYNSAIAGDGPRATPSISKEGRVYTMGSRGLLNCLDFQTGKKLWQRNIEFEHDVDGLQWGRSSSPLVLDDVVVINPGGSNNRSLVAYDQASGAIEWMAGDAPASYASPTLMELLGRRQIVMVNSQSVTAYDPLDGSLMWEQAFFGQQPHCSQPVAIGDDLVFLSSGYGVGSKLFRIISVDGEDSYRSETVWETKGMKAKFTNAVLHQGSLYGLDDGILVCLDPKTGQRRWKRGRYGHGQLILVGHLLLIVSENGDVALVKTNSQSFEEVARFPAIEGKTWNTPALKKNVLLLRNYKEAAAYQLPLVN